MDKAWPKIATGARSVPKESPDTNRCVQFLVQIFAFNLEPLPGSSFWYQSSRSIQVRFQGQFLVQIVAFNLTPFSGGSF